MSFKDKPLKKIVCDNRVTLDVIHQDKVRQFTEEKESIETKKETLDKLQTEYKHNSNHGILEKINILECDIQKYDDHKEIDYHLDTALLLSEYYSNKEDNVPTENIKMSVLDFMNKKIEKKDTKSSLINTYMTKVDDNTIMDNLSVTVDKCPLCKDTLTLKTIDSLLLCLQCGYTQKIIINSEKASYKDPPRESSYFAYKRINHFNEWLAQFQAKETTDIPEEVYQGILKELNKDPFITVKTVSYKKVREILKRLNYNKYYEHIPHIINILNGERAPLLTRAYEEQLRMMFREIQTPFIKHCPEERKNFLSYSYVLHKFCELLELDQLLIYFPLLKSREKLQQQDRIWEKICQCLKWQYIPSI
jgi:hypothetical protein